MKRSARLVAVLLLGVSFVAGGLAGMVLEEALGLDWFEFLDEDVRRGEGRLLADLRLSAEQQERVERILKRQEDRLESYWHQRLPEIRQITGEAHTEIRAILTPEQRATFDQRAAALGTRVPGLAED